MAVQTKTIAQLPVADTVRSNDQVVISQDNITKSATAGLFLFPSVSVTDLWTINDLYVGRDAFVRRDATVSGTLTVGSSAGSSSADVTRFNIGVEKKRVQNIMQYPYNAVVNGTTASQLSQTSAAIADAVAEASNLTLSGMNAVTVYIPGLPQNTNVVPSNNVYNSFNVRSLTFPGSGVSAAPRDGIRIIGDGWKSRIKQAPGINLTLLSVGTSGFHQSWCDLRDFVLDGNWGTSAGDTNILTGNTPLFYVNSLSPYISHVEYWRAGGRGMILDYDGPEVQTLHTPAGPNGFVSHLVGKQALKDNFVFKGPSDTSFYGCDWSTASQNGYGSVDVSAGSSFYPGAFYNVKILKSGKFVACHAHTERYTRQPNGTVQTSAYPLAAVKTSGGAAVKWSDSDAEGAQTLLHIGVSSADVTAPGSRFYAAAGGPSIKILSDNHSLGNITVRGPIASVSAEAGLVFPVSVAGIQLGATGRIVNNIDISGTMADNKSGPFSAGTYFAQAGVGINVSMAFNNCGAASDIVGRTMHSVGTSTAPQTAITAIGTAINNSQEVRANSELYLITSSGVSSGIRMAPNHSVGIVSRIINDTNNKVRVYSAADSEPFTGTDNFELGVSSACLAWVQVVGVSAFWRFQTLGI